MCKFHNRNVSAFGSSVLEIDIFVHSLCALLIYALWWRKPQDIHRSRSGKAKNSGRCVLCRVCLVYQQGMNRRYLLILNIGDRSETRSTKQWRSGTKRSNHQLSNNSVLSKPVSSGTRARLLGLTLHLYEFWITGISEPRMMMNWQLW